MYKFKVTGMSCAACSARVEKAVSGLEGVQSCSVNLLTNSMTVESCLPDEVIVAAVEIIQFATLSGSCDIDDLILNVFGAFLLYLFTKNREAFGLLKQIFLLE